jgi:uncharacterized protein with HEPN domain
MSRSIIEYFEHINNELTYLLQKSQGLDFDSFSNDETLKRAFSRSLEIVGEAVKNIPEEIRFEQN